MGKRIEAVIFDWAGTTVDFGSFAPVQAFVEAFKQFGVEPTVAEVREPMGMLKRMHIQTMMEMPRIRNAWRTVHGSDWTMADVDVVYAASETSIMGILQAFVAPKPFVLEVVEGLRSRGIQIGSTTGYTDAMMEIVVPKAAELGYSPDYWCSPNGVNNMGRPYPYMIFKNLEALKIMEVSSAIKVGDTTADIKEGKNAGMLSVGILEGSSVMGLSEVEFSALTEAEKAREFERVSKVYWDAGADYILQNMSGLLPLIEKISKGK